MRRSALLLLLGLTLLRAGCWLAPLAPAAAGPGGRGQAKYTQIKCTAAVFSPDGKLLFVQLTCVNEGEGLHDFRPLQLWDVRTGERLRAFPEPGWGALCFLPDGAHVLAGGRDQPLCVRVARTGKVVRAFRDAARDCYPLDVSPDGTVALVRREWGHRGSLELWDVAGGRRLRTLGEADYHRARFSPDGRHAYTMPSWGEDRGAAVWSVHSGRQLRVSAPAELWRHPRAFSASGRWAISERRDADDQYRLVLWEVASGKEALTFAPRRAGGNAGTVAFRPDGRHVVTGDSGATLRLWDAATGKEVWARKVNRRGVTAWAFSPDGRLAFAACGVDVGLGWDWMSLELWDTATGKRVRGLRRPEAG